MAFMPLMLAVLVAAMALGVNAIGACASDCYGIATVLVGCGDSTPGLDCFCKTYNDHESLVKMCANKCTGDWDDFVDTMPCANIETPDALTSSPGHETDDKERTSLENIIANIPGNSFHASATQASDRLARQKRRTVVADATAGRHVEHVNAESATAPKTYNLHEAGAKAKSQLTPNSLLERSSSLSKRDGGDGGDRPKWQPTVCTAPGVTCGNGGDVGNGGNVAKVEIRGEAESYGKTLPSRLAKREAEPRKIPPWQPTSCTAPGITCGDGNGEPPSVSEAKREAEPRKIPPWQPTSCTAPGITCGDDGDNIEPPSDSQAKRDAEPRKIPPWQPTSCTAPGITCGDNGDNTEPPSVSEATKRDAEPRKIPPWQPTSCTAPGITCGDNGEPPSVADAKREAQPMAVPENQLEARRKIPPWQPTSCTAPGITCGDNGKDEAGEASSTTSQAGVSKMVERDSEAAAAVQFGGTNKGTFTDDDSNVVDIQDV